MIKRFALASALTVVGSISVAGAAMAQSVTVPFNGTVGSACSISLTQAGVLGTYDYGSGVEYLATWGTGGSNAKVTSVCNSPVALSITAPVQTAGPTDAGVGNTYAQVYSPVSYVYADKSSDGYGNSSGTVAAGTNELDVYMSAYRANKFASGNYTYQSTVTITPQ